MSATVHIPSSGGGIVVDSGQPSDDATEASGSNLTGSVINLATNEIIATPQIIKLMSSEDAVETTEIGGNYRGPMTPQLMNSQSGSKVHVISNVTLVTKSQATQQAINLVNTTSKSINSSANSGYINAFVSKSIPPSGKIVNLVNPINKSQVNQVQKVSPIVQKVSVPRNVQVLTRVQTLTHATLGGNIIMSRLATSQPQHFQPTPKQTTVKATGYNSVSQKTPKIVSGTQQMFPQGMKIYTGSVGGQKVAQGVKTVTKTTSIKAPMPANKIKQVYSGSPAPNLTTITQQYPSMGKTGGIHIQSTMNNNAVPVKFNSIGGQAMASGQRTVSSVGNLVIQGGGQKMMKSNKVIQVHHNSAPQTTPHMPNQLKMVQNTTSVPSFNIIQGGTIKYVNAQGNVTQPPAPKLRSNIQNTGMINTTQSYVNPEASVDVANTEDMMYVNGMSMDEEISARILQSLSQKAVYNNNRYIQQQKYLISSPNTVTTDTSPQIPYPTQYQTQEGKHGPEYFRVNTSDLQTTTTTFIDNIPLVATNEEFYQRDQNYDQDDYTDGEEQITAKDTKLIMQHPALQDHTYAAPMPEGMAAQETPPENFQNTSANSTETSLAHILMGYSCNQQRQDDDNNSVISNDSRSGKNTLENDLGEETETAPEGEGEDDSVTRCICDLTHDDGYMICCDKCSAWQHVDCMGIDRQNIPDEYNCEVCQPRPVDKNRARSLQLIKRREQQSLMMLNTLPQQTIAIDSNVVTPPVEQQQRTLPLNNLSPTVKKQRSLGRKKGATEGFVGKRQKRDSVSRANGKRKETKKTTKRKNKQQPPENGGVEKSVMSLRTWIENYEQAVTNHYSPELRARLQALGKQQSHQQLNSQTVNLKNVGNLEGKCGTVPHAGGKILISSLEMTPNTPIVEIRGKYMLSGQYKQQLLTTTRVNRSPGPFIFFYRLPNEGPEICVDTRTYGNEARFVRRSCRPNAEVVHFIEKGTIHLYIVSMLHIKESTEITIRHEPHDLIGVGQGSAPAPTSTVCACGLTKDCLFPITAAPPVVAPPGKSAKRVNGNYHVKGKEGYKRSKSSFSRNRSTSSSGESNVGMLSPNGQVFVPTQISTTALAPPSIQPQLLEAAAAALSSPQASLPPTVTQMMNQYPPSPTRNHLNLSTASSATTMSIPGTPTMLSPNIDAPVAVKETTVVAALSPILPVVIPEPPPPPPPQVPAPQPIPEPAPTPKPVASKRLAKQKSVSLSEDGIEKVKEKLEEKSQPAKETTEARKLTREERKMEAIMKAFEKMEKTSQRKQELKQKTGSGSTGVVNPTGSVTRRRNSFSPFVKVKEEEEKKTLNNHQRKKKRKGSKSYQQVTSQRKRRRSRVNSNESDNGTSEESAMLSPPIAGASLYRNSEPVKAPEDAAGMLLALARTPVEEVKEEPDVGSFHSPLSSVCMLVEAAVAPLESQCIESDFKLPPKTKTKKTIMNEWLNQADSAGYQGSELFGGAGASPGKNLETLVQAAVSMGTQHYRGRIQEEPQNLSMMAKKVEEFITLTDGKSEGFGSEEDPVRSQEETTVLVPPPLPTPPMVGGSESAVKKRWLRQAISEECLDEMVPSPPNGFMTPLKKRRLARQCSDMVEDLSPTQVGFFPMAQPEVPESVDVKPMEIKNEVMVEEEMIEVKKEVEEPPQPYIKEEIQPESFDIEPLEPNKVEEIDSKEDDGNLADIEDVNNDEIADLQKKIHSFHAENILILKSRNRKVKQRVDSEDVAEKKPLKVKKKRQSSDDEEILDKSKIKSRSPSISPPTVKEESPESEVTEPPPPPLIPQGVPIELPVNFNSSIPPPSTSVTTYSSYLLNNATNLMTSIPPPSNFGIPPMFSNFPPPPLATAVPPPQLSDYLDNTTFRDIFTPTAPGYFATLNPPPQPVPPPVVPPVTPTGFLPKATFTSLDPIPTPAASTPAPRIYTRTASADPRLNPNISVPEPPPAPKRKLSITEYRKRKQQSTDCTSAGDMKPLTPEGDAGKDQEEFVNMKNVDILSDCKDDSSSSASATKTPSTPEENVPFSPTPTLLELQQESLSERLKSYKSLQELSNALPAREFFNSKGAFTESPSVSSTTCDAVTSSTDTIECDEKPEGEEVSTVCDGETVTEEIVQKEPVP